MDEYVEQTLHPADQTCLAAYQPGSLRTLKQHDRSTRASLTLRELREGINQQMSIYSIAPENLKPEPNSAYFALPAAAARTAPLTDAASAALAGALTKAASKQTYYTIRYLVDRDRVANAYRAYAYFRWLDDQLDRVDAPDAERIALIERQQALLQALDLGIVPSDLCAEEQLLFTLIGSDPRPHSGLRAYIDHMMAVMVFDTHRRDRLISAQELADYSHHLAAAVTEALHYFIGHCCFAPTGSTRYLAVTAAHITHMLRDTGDDLAAGYYNIPREYLEQHGIEPWALQRADALDGDAYRAWVADRVALARAYFNAGRQYLAQVGSLRCRAAGYAYVARFEGVLDTIERDGYRLRAEYNQRKTLRGGLNMGWSTLSMLLHSLTRGYA